MTCFLSCPLTVKVFMQSHVQKLYFRKTVPKSTTRAIGLGQAYILKLDIIFAERAGDTC